MNGKDRLIVSIVRKSDEEPVFDLIFYGMTHHMLEWHPDYCREVFTKAMQRRGLDPEVYSYETWHIRENPYMPRAECIQVPVRPGTFEPALWGSGFISG